MEQNTQTVEQALPETPPDAVKLLESANSSSEHVGVLHLGFIVACAYIIIIAVGRTDLDLLIGKGIRLPVIDTEIPIVGFFAFAPWLLVIVHFNLLLHLQLLARKLHAFDSADAQGELRDQLRIFPITYFLAGRTDERTRKLLSFMVSITLILLPLLTMLLLQLQFLAYQSEAVTWGQRFAIWLDIAQLTYFWPIIVELKGESCTIKERWNSVHQSCLPRIRDWIAPALSGTGFMLLFCGTDEWYFIAGLSALLLSAIASTLYEPRPVIRFLKTGGIILLPVLFLLVEKTLIIELHGFWEIVNSASYVEAISGYDQLKLPLQALITMTTSAAFFSLGHRHAPRSGMKLVFAAQLAISLSLGFMVDGEILEKQLLALQSSGRESTGFSQFILNKRILNLREQRLFANHPEPEIVAQLRSDDWKNALQKIEPVNLQGRSLRHANFTNTLLCRANLKDADLQGAYLTSAQMQGANLSHANLPNAILFVAQLQCTDLSNAQLQGIISFSTQLQGASLSDAQLQGANLPLAQLQGADLKGAQLQGANLCYAQLQGADLSGAQLQGVDLRMVALYGAILGGANTMLVDARGLNWEPLTKDNLDKLTASIIDLKKHETFLKNQQQAALPNAPKASLQSCLADDQLPLYCGKRYNLKHLEEMNAYREHLNQYLANLTSKSLYIARSIIFQIPWDNNNHPLSSRAGLATVLVKRLDAGNAPGLQALSDDEKTRLRKLAKQEQASLRK